MVRSQDLTAVFCGVLIVGLMLWALTQSLPKPMPNTVSGQAPELAAEKSMFAPAPGVESTQAATYNVEELRTACVDEIRDRKPPAPDSACARYERATRQAQRTAQPSAAERARRALAVMEQSRELRLATDRAQYGSVSGHVSGGSSAQSGPACARLQSEKEQIDARMRRPYGMAEGEQYRGRLRAIDRQLCIRSCVTC